MAAYRVARAFERIPEITGLELNRHGQKWQGGYYLNGDRHAYRRDKLKVVFWKNDIFLFEEGGRGMSLVNWLQQYGGAADYRDAVKIIDGESVGFSFSTHDFRKKEVKTQYISADVVRGLKSFDLRKCNLFKWMCKMFPEDKVREVWDKYNTCTDSHGNAVFLYTDQDGHVLFDKRIFYKEDGHREKNFFPARKFRVADGYNGRCYFGSNTLKDYGKVYVCESEKSCLLVALQYGKQCVATGGKSNLTDVDSRMMLLPDLDAREEWSNRGTVWPWWEKWGIPVEDMPRTADIGDMITAKKLCASGQ